MKQRLALVTIPALALALFVTMAPRLSASDVRDKGLEDLIARSGSRCVATANWSIGLPDDLAIRAAEPGPVWISESIFLGTADQFEVEASAGVIARSQTLIAVRRQDSKGPYIDLYMALSVDGQTLLVLSETSRPVPCTDG